MAREIIVKTWCDVHLAEDEHVEGEELPPLSLTPGKPRVVALCEVHRKELYEPLVQVLAELGQPADVAGNLKPPRRSPGSGPRARGGPVPCPVEGCDYPGGRTRDAVNKHAKAHHGARLSELEAQATTADPLTCPECGDTFATARGMGSHRRIVHGIAGSSKSARLRREAAAE